MDSLDTTFDHDLVSLRVHDTEDFLSLVPYLLGYRPDEQLVLLVLEGTRLRLSAAVPLAGLADPGSAREAVLAALGRLHDPWVLLACWSGDTEQAEAALGLAEVWVGAARVLDSVVVGRQAWWSRSGGPCGCVADLAQTPAVAHAVVAGLSAAASREEVVRAVAGPPPEEVTRIRGGVQAAEQRLAEVPVETWSARALEQRDRLAADEELWSSEAGAELMVLCQDPQVRRELWLGMRRSGAAREERAWLRVVAGCPPEWAVGPLLCLGFAAWLAGSGAVLVACVERLLALAPWNEGTHLLDQLNREATPPQAWEEVRDAWALGRLDPLDGAVADDVA